MPDHEDSSTDVEDSSTDDEQPAASPSLKRASESSASTTAAKQPKLTPPSANPSFDALNFLRSRPQIAAMNIGQEDTSPKAAATVAPAQSIKASTSERKVSDVEKTMLPDLGSESPPSSLGSSSWQQHETIPEFLRRLPVADPNTARVGPWLGVQCSPELQDSNDDRNLDAFLETASPLLDGLLKQRVTIEQKNPGKAPGTITRKMSSYRDQLEVDLLNTATKFGITSSKWMIFPKADDLPRTWRLVAEATAEGKLGPVSKVGTWEPKHATEPTVICVYTKDFSDLGDVKRVLNSLIEAEIIRRDANIYYKCDAYTYLQIMSENKYKLKASLYSSEEMFHGKVKYDSGVISRLKINNGGAMAAFLNS